MSAPLPHIPDIPGVKLATGRRILLVSLLMLAVYTLVYAVCVMKADGLNLPQGVPLGGDFVAFWAPPALRPKDWRPRYIRPASLRTG